MPQVEVHQVQLHFDLNPELTSPETGVRVIDARPKEDSPQRQETTTLISEQDAKEAEVDKLVDQGFTYASARRVLGIVAVGEDRDEKPTPHPAQPGTGRRRNKSVGPNDRRRLSTTGKMIADGPPPHIKRY